MALMLARAHTANYDIICLRNGYHGMSMETMGLCGQHTWKQPMPQGFGIRHAMNPDPYRGPFGNDGKRCVVVQRGEQQPARWMGDGGVCVCGGGGE
jgi:alanine-glyoxylate transaminase/(R)-3-amino-2-methylpropionate-pyruvate transaminase